MANVYFKRGTHANLFDRERLPSYQEGSFYLTTDTDRLYFAQSDNELVELNKSITTISSINQLPLTTGDTSKEVKGNEVAVGQFYYIMPGGGNGANVQNGNILAVCSGIDGSGNITWTQINPDTNENDHLNNITISGGTATTTNKDVAYELTYNVVDKNGSTSTANSGTAAFSIKATDILAMIGMSSSAVVASNNVTVTSENLIPGTNNANSTVGQFTIHGGTNITITQATDGFAISSAAGESDFGLKVSSAENEVSAYVENANNTTVKDTFAVSGANGIVVSSTSVATASGTQITAIIGHSSSATSVTTATNLQLNNTTAGNSFEIVKSIACDDWGHVTAVTVETVKAPIYSMSAITADNEGNLVVTLIDQANQASSATANGVLYNTITVDGGEPRKVYNQGDLGSFYSASHIDSLLKSLDALTYKGTLGTATGSTTSTLPAHPGNGDTYKVVTAGEYAGYDCQVGDLLIATGTETDGVIASPSWTLVANGDDTDTTYTLAIAAAATTNNGADIGIINSVNNNAQLAHFVGDSIISVTANTATTEITISHAESGVTSGTYGNSTTSVAAGGSISIPSIKVDEKGHITSATNISVALPGNNTLHDDGNKVIGLRDAEGSNLSTIEVKNGAKMVARVTHTSDTAIEVRVDHDEATVSTTASTNTAVVLTKASSSVAVITGITADAYGHINTVTTTPYDFSQLARELSASADTATNKLAVFLTDAGNNHYGTATISISSASASVAVSSTSTTNGINVNVEIEWGSF